MPSPFPGMDPFIEGRSWAHFHHFLISCLADRVMPRIRPRYAIRVEERVYLEQEVDGRNHFRPDLTILDDGSVPLRRGPSSGGVATVPISITLPMPEEVTEHYLSIRDSASFDI